MSHCYTDVKQQFASHRYWRNESAALKAAKIEDMARKSEEHTRKSLEYWQKAVEARESERKVRLLRCLEANPETGVVGCSH